MYPARVRSVLEELRAANPSVAYLAATPHGTLKISLPNTFGRRCVVPDWPLASDGSYVTFKPHGPLVSDSSELLHAAALQDSGIILAPDWLIRRDIESGALVEVLTGWAGEDNYDISVVLPPDRLVPAKTRVFIDELAGNSRKNWLSAF